MKRMGLVIGSCFVLSCGQFQPSQSDTDVVNGVHTNQYPAVVKYFSLDGDNNAIGMCTGTFITERIMLTAAHCFKSDGGNVLYRDIVSTRVFVNPNYSHSGRATTFGPYDFALAEFSYRMVDNPMKLGENPIAAGDSITMIGYGHNDYTIDRGKLEYTGYSSAGYKRIGYNFISSLDNTINVIGSLRNDTGNGTNTSLGGGDSGGPAIINNRIYGVASYISSRGDDKLTSTYSYVLSSAANRFFDDAKLEGFDLDGILPIPEPLPEPLPGMERFDIDFKVYSDSTLISEGLIPRHAVSVVLLARKNDSWVKIAEKIGEEETHFKFVVKIPNGVNRIEAHAYDQNNDSIDSVGIRVN